MGAQGSKDNDEFEHANISRKNIDVGLSRLLALCLLTNESDSSSGELRNECVEIMEILMEKNLVEEFDVYV